jgi:hypothetical protein
MCWFDRYARECYCGKNVNFSTAAKSTACTMTCPGNRLEKCGGGNVSGSISPYLSNTNGCSG